MFTRKELKKDTERIIAGLERRGEKDARSQIETILRGLGGMDKKEAELKKKLRKLEKIVAESATFEPHNKYPNRDI